MCESERANGRDEEHIPLSCERSLAVHLADAVIGDIGAICARHAVGMLSLGQVCGAIDEHLRVLAGDRPTGRLLERAEIRLVSDVLDSVHASRLAAEAGPGALVGPHGRLASVPPAVPVLRGLKSRSLLPTWASHSSGIAA